MEALEFLKERKRMCRSFGGSCRGCPCEKVRCVINAYVSDDDYKRIVAMVEEWSAAHPRKTRQSVFLEQECPTTTCTVEGYHHPIDLHECDFTDGKCPHGEDIVWWLQQPAEED